MVELRQVPQVILVLVFVGLVLGAGLLAISQFQTAVGTTYTYNGNITRQVFANVSDSVGNFAGQMPVIGTLLGISVLIMVVMIAFAFGGRMTGGAGGATAAGY